MSIFENVIRVVCMYHTVSCDEYHKWVDACHCKKNIPEGDSWGECSPDKCPFLNANKDSVK